MKPIIVNWQWPLDLASWINGFKVTGIEFIPLFIIVDKNDPNYDRTVRHETTHFYQMMECLILPWYLLYGCYYLSNRLMGLNHKLAYMAIPFEEEAYANQNNKTYNENRKWYAWARI